MHIREFINKYKNHPILFVGSGLSFRYLTQSYTWDNLLKTLAFDLKENQEYYLKLKYKYDDDFAQIATILEEEYDDDLDADRNGRFKDINDQFYKRLEEKTPVSRFKLCIAKKLENSELNHHEEIQYLKEAKKNIGSIITTNYDLMCEKIFEFNPLIGNDILLSNPYGSLYKIHGCITQPNQIIITQKDYNIFSKRYELIRAQLISLFVHNPIIFLGYSLKDPNIKDILETIFSYVDANSKQATLIKNNFLLVSHDKGSDNQNISDFDVLLNDNNTITISCLKTDNYKELYQSLSELNLPVSAMDVRKVQAILKEIVSGGNISVQIDVDINSLKNADKVLALTSQNKYIHLKASEIVDNYFEILEKKIIDKIQIIDKLTIHNNQFFPIYGFLELYSNIKRHKELQNNQLKKIKSIVENVEKFQKEKNVKLYNISISSIKNQSKLSNYMKEEFINYYVIKGSIDPDEYKDYIISEFEVLKKDSPTNYRKGICVYDYVKFCRDKLP